jgi:hypothetical protein
MQEAFIEDEAGYLQASWYQWPFCSGVFTSPIGFIMIILMIKTKNEY